MATDSAWSEILLPERWPASVKSATVHVVSLAHLAIIQSRLGRAQPNAIPGHS